ncbi:NAD-dependent epimerase/dehydratase family protein [Saccharothrix luteola]|uniref:NAD-dependent epimerase/dehydratase family protein n=1 Tax=Saccharothrix luteola TaxID=2893018 RepID=UPI001E326750|nr:NAD-dependent epimerase/dehydratase family protein [Saccharothrix luteola]MCC8251224.1 NAD-dependent epimerase/dehydratase family protein [Saccharothrix luteola]
MHAVVVGARGFLGSALAAGLERASAQVSPITRGEPALVDDVLSPALRTAEVVFCVATSVTPGTAERFPERADRDLADFTRLVAALGALGTNPTVVLAGSADCYDRAAEPPFTERTPLRPGTAYSRCKLEMEKVLRAAPGVRPVVARLASLYGPGHRTDPGHGVIAHWLTAVAQGERLRQIGDDDITRDFVYVDDVVDALLRISRHTGDLPFALNIGSGDPVSLGRLRREVEDVTGVRSAVDRSPSREFDRRTILLDVGLAEDVLGWRPVTTFTEGLRRTWKAVQEG